jgi:hypothetical protein
LDLQPLKGRIERTTTRLEELKAEGPKKSPVDGRDGYVNTTSMIPN